MSKDRHHFVPRFYLKHFTFDKDSSEPRQINLYNIAAKKIIPDKPKKASIGGQCQKHKFYGENDKVENTLAFIESYFAATIKKICTTKSLPDYNSTEYQHLLVFISTQLLRTNKSAENLNKQVGDFAKTIMDRDSQIQELVREGANLPQVSLKQPAITSLSLSSDGTFCINDLRGHLLESPPTSEFITSDHPVFCYNIYREGCIEPSSTGLLSIGLLLFLPLSPCLCLLLYDPQVYKVGGKNSQISMLTQQDVKSINGLQFIGAEENLYFSGNIPDLYFKQLVANYERKRNETGQRTIEFQQIDNPLRMLVCQYYHIPNLRLNLEPITILRDARRVPLSDRVNKFRKEVPQLKASYHDKEYTEDERTSNRVFKRVREIL
jgi:hypothetical protein